MAATASMLKGLRRSKGLEKVEDGLDDGQETDAQARAVGVDVSELGGIADEARL